MIALSLRSRLRIAFAFTSVSAAFALCVNPANADFSRPIAPEAYFVAPYLHDLVASKAGDRIAWLAEDRGRAQVWVATGPDFAPHALVQASGSDGRPFHSLSFSDDGAHLAYVRGYGTLNPTSDPRGAKQEVWVVATDARTPALLIGNGGEPKFRPDGKSVAFVEEDAINSSPIDRAADQPLFAARGKIHEPTWSPDGSRLAFSSDRGDHSFVGVFDVTAQTVSWLAPSFDKDASPVWSPDGKRVAFVRFRGDATEPAHDDEIYASPPPVSVVVVNVATGQTRVVVREDPTGGYAQDRNDPSLMWGKDDRIVFFSERDGWVRLWSVAADGMGTPTVMSPPDCEVEFPSVAVDRSAVLVTANCGDINRRHLWTLPLAHGLPQTITTGQGLEWNPVMTSSGSVAYIGSEARDVPSILVVDPRRSAPPRRITASAATLGLASYVAPETISFHADDGVEIRAQLLLPPGRSGAKKPAIVFLHGGPIRQMMPGWHPMGYYHHTYELNQYLVARGYAVLEVNYRLGVGYGRAFRRVSHAGPFGASEYRDVLAAAHYLAQRGDIDPARVGLWGGSYGGYLTGLALSRDSATFRAGVDVSGVHDCVRDEPDVFHNEDEKKIARASSPIGSVATWTSPVLLIHGDDDKNVAFAQTTDLVQRLRVAGRAPVELLAIPDEDHYFELHATWLDIARRSADFFDRYLTKAGR